MLTGVVVTVSTGIILWQKTGFWEALFWQALILPCLIFLSLDGADRQPTTRRLLALWLFLALIFVLSCRVTLGIFFIYTIVWVAIAVHHIGLRWAWVWLVLVNTAWFFVREYVWQDSQAMMQTLLVGTFHLFALLSSLSSKEAAEANEKTQKLNRELMATQHLLGESSRESERTRIARDLHDLVGHHLTALSINLQVASHLSQGEAKEKIDQCHSLSKLLLSDVRDAVSTLRTLPVVDLGELLSIAIKDIPRLNIQMDVAEGLQLDDTNTAEALLRTVQEAITNTLKHSTATRAQIRVTKQQDTVILEYRDNGREVGEIVEGNGLTGMRERIEKLGGNLQISTEPGFTLTATSPLAC